MWRVYAHSSLSDRAGSEHRNMITENPKTESAKNVNYMTIFPNLTKFQQFRRSGKKSFRQSSFGARSVPVSDK